MVAQLWNPENLRLITRIPDIFAHINGAYAGPYSRVFKLMLWGFSHLAAVELFLVLWSRQIDRSVGTKNNLARQDGVFA